jgi:exodeoxyribonuclease V beta subunit
MSNQIKNDFHVIDADLNGNNTIEASAGTGKTYSLAILVVRLLLEKKLPIEQILLVTFTEAAAAELKERTAKFIRLALKETVTKGSSKEENIEKIVEKCELDNETKQKLLRQALLDMDKATMATIHSFCQQTLTEFAFETGQEFGKELMTDISEITNHFIDDFIRSTLSIEGIQICKGTLVSALNNFMNGQKFYSPLPREMFDRSFQELQEGIAQCEYDLANYFTPEKRNELSQILFKEKISGVAEKTIEKIAGILSSNEETLNMFIRKNPKPFVEHCVIENNYISERTDYLNKLKSTILPKVILQIGAELPEKVKQKLNEKNALTFNDLIQLLYNVRENPDLIKLMRAKYKAVFVDEFQDTDPKQYGIFKTFFQDDDETVLFFIGDPKQSIYGWRQADVETYRSARDSDKMKKLKMNKNFRSSASFIAAANEFFQLDSHSKLEYVEVEAKDNKTDSGLFAQDEPIPAIQILKSDAGQDANEFTQEVMKYLFSDALRLRLNKDGKALINNVSPANVAVLVRTGRQGKEVKRVLDKLNIPSVLIADENVFASQEAKELKIIFKAILNINSGNIKHAFITRLIGMDITQLHQINEDVVLPFFHQCKSLLEKDGISKMMENFFQFFRIIEKHREDPIGGHQVLANTRQILSILQEQTLQQALTPTEVQAFLNDQINNPENKNEAFQQTIENDETAVKIMTIHKSKGLEFDVVVLPHLNLKAEEGKHWDYTSFRKQENGAGNYYFTLKGTPGEPQDLFRHQAQEENERLLYVALTRAKFNAFVFGGKVGKKSSGPHLLTPYLEAADDKVQRLNLSEFVSMHGDTIFQAPVAGAQAQNKKDLGEIMLLDSNYHKLSYSFLAAKHAYHPKEESETFDENSYEHFIFKELPKGAHIGNVLHDMFEFSDFTTNENWSFSIEKALRKFFPSVLQDEKKKAHYLNQLQYLMQLVVETSFHIGGEEIQLSAIPNEKRINELEFNFPIPEEFNPTELEQVIDDEQREIKTTLGAVKGMMNGFVDLFFEHNGKYYILDWKSNFLGDQDENYAPENLVQAMNESNYHLQYLLYAVAVDKFLRSRLGNDYNFEAHFGGVVYVFLRGVRPEKKHGFFVQKVKKKELDQLRGVLLGNKMQEI